VQRRPIGVAYRAALYVVLAGAALLTIAVPYRHTFGLGFVNVQTHDSWYHLRVVEYDVANFPRVLHFDPYLEPGGGIVPVGPLYDWLIAGGVKALCPAGSTDCLEHVAAFASPLAGLLTLLVVFEIGRRLAGPAAGIGAAALLATMPSPFFDLTLLGVVDHHAGEALFGALTLLSLIGVVSGFSRTNVWSAAAGAALGAYLLTWTSGALLVAILAVWAGAQYVVDGGAGASQRVARALAIAVVIAAVCVFAFEDARTPSRGLQLLALAGTLGGLAALEALARLWRRFGLPPAAFVIAPVALAVLTFIAARRLTPVTAETIRIFIERMQPQTRTSEAEGMAAHGGVAATAWWMFRTGLIAAAPGVLLMLHGVWKRRPEAVLVAVFTAAMFAATLGQIRFGLYLAIGLALAGGWFIDAAARAIGVRFEPIAACALTAALCYPNIASARFNAALDWGLPYAWHVALLWMRDMTPEPFGDASRYLSSGGGDAKPSYTVMDWWEHGYWIVRQAHRVPVANPMQTGIERAARFYTETDPAKALEILREARSRYVVIGDEVPEHFDNAGGSWLVWFRGMVDELGIRHASYSESLSQVQADGSSVPVIFYYPAYYQAMAHRLYLFGGRAVTPKDSSWVATIVEKPDSWGSTVRLVENLKQCATFEEAEAEVSRRGPGEHRIVGLDPMKSPVPLEAMRELRVVFDSPVEAPAFPQVPAARIFEVAEAAR
jgi:asparagine N-glycosylation enzyme membrane subunit Stt3